MTESLALTRRRFLQALAASTLAAGAALPVGMPKEAAKPRQLYLTDPDAWFITSSDPGSNFAKVIWPGVSAWWDEVFADAPPLLYDQRARSS